MAVDVALPFREKVTKNRAELRGADSGVEIRYYPGANGAVSIANLVTNSIQHDMTSRGLTETTPMAVPIS